MTSTDVLWGGTLIRSSFDPVAWHHDPAFTLRTYTHLMPSSNDAARHAIDASWTTDREADEP